MDSTLTELSPMLLHETRRAFDSSQHLFELKFDGYRLLAEVHDGKVTLKTRHGHDATGWFPEVVRGLAVLSAGRHVLDGEACVLDDIGRSDFERLQARARRRRWYAGCDAVTFCAFDVLVHGGRSVMQRPLVERKALLHRLLTPRPSSTLFVGDVPHDGIELYRRAEALKLEGIVAKRKDSIYLPGERAPHWVKVKRPGWNEGRSWSNS